LQVLGLGGSPGSRGSRPLRESAGCHSKRSEIKNGKKKALVEDVSRRKASEANGGRKGSAVKIFPLSVQFPSPKGNERVKHRGRHTKVRMKINVKIRSLRTRVMGRWGDDVP